MVRALIDGRKTQTRRALNPQPFPVGGPFYRPYPVADPNYWYSISRRGLVCNIQKVRYAPGDRLYVREEWSTHPAFDGIAPRDLKRGSMIYTRADHTWHNAEDWIGAPFGRRRAGMHMPRWASRLTLMVTDVRVQRLQECTEEDAIAEGCVWDDDKAGFWVPGVEHHIKNFPYLARATAREMYAALWDTINGSGEWLKNPWIVAITFTVEKRNIDQI
jgi:hypothetical protein